MSTQPLLDYTLKYFDQINAHDSKRKGDTTNRIARDSLLIALDRLDDKNLKALQNAAYHYTITLDAVARFTKQLEQNTLSRVTVESGQNYEHKHMVASNATLKNQLEIVSTAIAKTQEARKIKALDIQTTDWSDYRMYMHGALWATSKLYQANYPDDLVITPQQKTLFTQALERCFAGIQKGARWNFNATRILDSIKQCFSTFSKALPGRDYAQRSELFNHFLAQHYCNMPTKQQDKYLEIFGSKGFRQCQVGLHQYERAELKTENHKTAIHHFQFVMDAFPKQLERVTQKTILQEKMATAHHCSANFMKTIGTSIAPIIEEGPQYGSPTLTTRA